MEVIGQNDMLSPSDEKLIHLVNENRDIDTIRQLINDSIHTVESGNVLIGLDITDLEELFKDNKELYIGMVNSNDASDPVELVEELIKSTTADVSGCSSVYLYLEGDLSLMDVNDVATALDATLGEEVDVVFTATYNEMTLNEYDVMAVFLYNGSK